MKREGEFVLASSTSSGTDSRVINYEKKNPLQTHFVVHKLWINMKTISLSTFLSHKKGRKSNYLLRVPQSFLIWQPALGLAGVIGVILRNSNFKSLDSHLLRLSIKFLRGGYNYKTRKGRFK